MGEEKREKIAEALTKYKSVGIDTCVFIYHFQRDAKYSSLTTAFFDLLEQGKLYGYTSVLTKLEVFIEPRRQGNEDLVNTLNFALETWPNLELREFDDYVIDKAATLRAKYNITTPDAIQIGSALASGAGAFITNDRTIRKVRELDILLLSNLIG